jgi:hypothetical protein
MTRGALVTALQAAATVLLFVLLFRGVDLQQVRAALATTPLWFYATSLLIVGVGQLLYAWRWRVLLAATGIEMPFRLVLMQYLVGVFMNNFLPSTIGGDAARVFYVGRAHGYRAVTASVVLDRMLGFGILATLATAALWLQPLPHPRYAVARLALTGVTAAFGGIVVLALAGTGGLPARVARLGGGAVAVAERLQRFRLELAGVVRSPVVWANTVVTVVVYCSLLTFAYQRFAALQQGVAPGFVPVLTALASLSVLSTVPVAINGLGVREQLHVLLLAPLGIDGEVAVAISLLLFAHMLLVSVAGGLLWWRIRRAAQAGTSSSAIRSL